MAEQCMHVSEAFAVRRDEEEGTGPHAFAVALTGGGGGAAGGRIDSPVPRRAGSWCVSGIDRSRGSGGWGGSMRASPLETFHASLPVCCAGTGGAEGVVGRLDTAGRADEPRRPGVRWGGSRRARRTAIRSQYSTSKFWWRLRSSGLAQSERYRHRMDRGLELDIA